MTLERVWLHDVAERGIIVDRASTPSSVAVRGSSIERVTLEGDELNGAELVLEHSVVRDVQYYAVLDTLPRELDGLLGGGIAFVAELSWPEEGA